MSFIKKENLVISIGEYEKDGATKQQYKVIGEIITMQGNDGPYQFFKMWGPTGVMEGKVFDQSDRNAAQPQQQAAPQQQQYQQQPQQQQAPQQQYQQQPPQNYQNQNN